MSQQATITSNLAFFKYENRSFADCFGGGLFKKCPRGTFAGSLSILINFHHNKIVWMEVTYLLFFNFAASSKNPVFPHKA